MTPQTTRPRKRMPRFPWQPIAVFGVLALALFLLSQNFFTSQKKIIRQCKETELSAMAGMKAAQITNWRDDWINLANYYFENSHIISGARQLVADPGLTKIKEVLLNALSNLRNNFRFKRAVLHLSRGQAVLTYPEDASPDLNPGIVDLVHKAWQTRGVEFGDIYAEEESGQPILSLVIPLLTGNEKEGEPIPFLTFDIDPRSRLFPLLGVSEEFRPSPEILLVRREANDFLVLNEPPVPSTPPLSLRIPIANLRRAKGETALGEEGIVEGTDHRGLPVLASIKAVPQTSWLILAAADMGELYGGLNRKRFFLVIAAAFLIVASGLLLGQFWRLERAAHEAGERAKWDQATQKMYEFIQLIVDVMPNPAFFKDVEGRYLGCNAAFEKLLGLPKKDILSKTIREIAPSELLAPHEEVDDVLLKEPGYRIYESRLKAWDGEHHVIFIKATYIHPDGSVGGILGILKDITQRKRAEEELDELRKFSDGTIRTMTEGLVLTDTEGRLTFVNPAAAAMLGYTPYEMIDRQAKSFVREEHHHLVDEANRRRAQGLSDRYELDFIHKDGSPRTILVCGGPRIEGITAGGTLAVLTDITERKRMELEIRELSLTDELTKLYNRRGFTTLAEQQLKIASRMRKKVLLLYMDIDDFKVINDTRGHTAGDQALIDIAGLLRKNFRESDLLARMGGDEFTVLAMETARMNSDALTGRLREKLALHNSKARARGHGEIGLSLGAVLFDPEVPSSLDDMIIQADALMYDEKRTKKEARNRRP